MTEIERLTLSLYDSEQDRHSLVRAIDRAVDLLSVLPHALEHGETEVVKEYIDRVLTILPAAVAGQTSNKKETK